MNAPEILIDKLLIFIDKLRLLGYNIGTTQFILVQNLILSLAKQGQLPSLAQLKTLLAPILCHSPKEQQDFYQRFEQWVQSFENINDVIPAQDNVIPAKAGIHEKPTPSPISKKRWFFIVIISMTVIAGIYFYFQQDIPIEPITPVQTTPSVSESEGKHDESINPKNNPPKELPKPPIPKPEPEKPEFSFQWYYWIAIVFSLLILLSHLGRVKTPSFSWQLRAFLVN